jgi:hypothetical protein
VPALRQLPTWSLCTCPPPCDHHRVRGGGASLVVRYRRARGIERQQLRWVALGTVVVALLAVVNLASLTLGAYALAPLVGGLNPPILSVAIGAAILRYRLYDLDHILRRTLTWGLLTVLLGGGYAGVSWGWGSCWAATPAWSWPGPPWRWRRCSSRPAAGSKRWWISGSTGAAMTRPGSSRDSVPTCATRSTSHPHNRPAGGGRPDHAADPGIAVATVPARTATCPGLAMTRVGTDWRAARDSNPQPPDPEAGALRPPSTPECCWCSSGQVPIQLGCPSPIWLRLVDCHADCHGSRLRSGLT